MSEREWQCSAWIPYGTFTDPPIAPKGAFFRHINEQQKGSTVGKQSDSGILISSLDVLLMLEQLEKAVWPIVPWLKHIHHN